MSDIREDLSADFAELLAALPESERGKQIVRLEETAFGPIDEAEGFDLAAELAALKADALRRAADPSPGDCLPLGRGRPGRPGRWDVWGSSLDDACNELSDHGLNAVAIVADLERRGFDPDAFRIEAARVGLDLDAARQSRVGGATSEAALDDDTAGKAIAALASLALWIVALLLTAMVVSWALLKSERERRAGLRERQTKWRAKNPEKARDNPAAWRSRNREKERADVRVWRAANPEKVRAKRKEDRNKNYFRSFVAIDSEGRDYPGEAIFYSEASGKVRYERHDTYLWSAAANDGREPEWLTAENTLPADKKPLGVYETLDWLLSLPNKFGDANFIAFSFGYDVTQILKHMPYPTAWEIVKRETYSKVKAERKPIGSSPVFWDEYAFSYIKGKFFEIRRLRDRDNLYKLDETGERILNKDGKPIIDYAARIKIYDTFSYFQKGLSKVVDSMVKGGRATPEEAEIISVMKKRREDPEIWAAQDIDVVKQYTTVELRCLARMMCDLRKSFDDVAQIRPQAWHGPGAVASALMAQHKIKERHYPVDIAADEITPWQNAAHHAYFGGHIEMMKHGYIENTTLHVYDIASAYPAAMVDFASMKDGRWTKSGEVDIWTLSRLRAYVESVSQLFMFRIKYLFPEYIKYNEDISRATLIPFFPLPYRGKHGQILYPAKGYGFYMRDDVLAMIAWLEHFVPDYPRRRKKENKETTIIIEDAWIFSPSPAHENEKPFAVIRALYDERKRIQEEAEAKGVPDIREQAIKLPINAGYGQLARSVGDSGKVPAFANPWYAAAATAYTRRRLIEAAMIDPQAVVFFATDGIVSLNELRGLQRVRKSKKEVHLGDWEYLTANRGLFIMPGVYSYDKTRVKDNGEIDIEHVTKTRGADPKKYDKEKEAHEFLISATLDMWRKDYRTEGKNPALTRDYKKYITIGAALASVARFKTAGRWSPASGRPNAAQRVINLSDPGNKRVLTDFEGDCVSTAEREAPRCHSLVRTTVAWNSDEALSQPRIPDWLDEELGEFVREQDEQDAINQGFE